MASINKFEIRKERFGDLLEKLQDLSQISDTVKIRFEAGSMMAYSLVSSDTAALCLKVYFLATEDYLSGFPGERCHDFVMYPAPKSVKSLRFFAESERIRVDMSHRPSHEDEAVMHVRSMSVHTPAAKGDRLRISLVGAELSKIRDLKKSALESRMDPARSTWGFELTQGDLATVKRLAGINGEDRTVSISVVGGLVYFSEEGRWNLQVAQSDRPDKRVTFAKKYLSHFDTRPEKLQVNMFESFILVSTGDSRLLLSFETDFTNED